MWLDVPETPGLTWMERSVQGLLAQGKRTCDIADIMGVSANYVSKMRLKIRRSHGPQSTKSGPESSMDPSPQSGPESNRMDYSPHPESSMDPSPQSGPESNRMDYSPHPKHGTKLALKTTSKISLGPTGVSRTSKTSRSIGDVSKNATDFEHQVMDTFNAIQPVTNWPSAWRAVHSLTAKAKAIAPDTPEEALKAMIAAYVQLTRGEFRRVDRRDAGWWRGKACTPQMFSSMFDHVAALLRNHGRATQVEIEEQIF